MAQNNNAVELLEFLSTTSWLEHCRSSGPLSSRAKRIPAGTTYLSQLLAHDMFMTEPRKNVFHSNAESRGTTIAANLVRTPLLLDTIYGRTGVADLPLYLERDPETKKRDPRKFDLFEFSRNGKNYKTPKFHRDPRENWSHPVLADARNYSTPILAQIAFAFMAFHNRLVEAFDAQEVDNTDVFALARANVIRTWHKIVQNDIIDATCRHVTKEHMPESIQRMDFWSQPEILSLGVFRSFHALVRENYVFNSRAENRGTRSKVKEVLSAEIRGPVIGTETDRGPYSEAMKALVASWLMDWKIDLGKFFDHASQSDQALNRTGFTPSFTFKRIDRANNKEEAIQILDTKRAAALNQGGLLEEASISSAVDALIADVQGISTKPMDALYKSVPLHIALLAEGFYDSKCADGDLGKLGRIGSAIVRCRLGVELNRAKQHVDEVVEVMLSKTRMPDLVEPPENFVDMVNMTHKQRLRFHKIERK